MNETEIVVDSKRAYGKPYTLKANVGEDSVNLTGSGKLSDVDFNLPKGVYNLIKNKVTRKARLMLAGSILYLATSLAGVYFCYGVPNGEHWDKIAELKNARELYDPSTHQKQYDNLTNLIEQEENKIKSIPTAAIAANLSINYLIFAGYKTRNYTFAKELLDLQPEKTR